MLTGTSVAVDGVAEIGVAWTTVRSLTLSESDDSVIASETREGGRLEATDALRDVVDARLCDGKPGPIDANPANWLAVGVASYTVSSRTWPAAVRVVVPSPCEPSPEGP